MTRPLPTHPSLEHLKKEAKARLRALRRHDPTVALAAAQHIIAREYGFASWPKLKTYVDALIAGARPTMASHPASPLAGAWRANLSKSTRHLARPFQSATLHFDVAGDAVTVTDVVVDEDGRAQSGQNTLVVDGQEHAAAQRGYAVVARWRGPRVLDVRVTKGDQREGRVRYEVSLDGKTLLLTTDEQHIVLERLPPPKI